MIFLTEKETFLFKEGSMKCPACGGSKFKIRSREYDEDVFLQCESNNLCIWEHRLRGTKLIGILENLIGKIPNDQVFIDDEVLE